MAISNSPARVTSDKAHWIMRKYLSSYMVEEQSSPYRRRTDSDPVSLWDDVVKANTTEPVLGWRPGIYNLADQVIFTEPRQGWVGSAMGVQLIFPDTLAKHRIVNSGGDAGDYLYSVQFDNFLIHHNGEFDAANTYDTFHWDVGTATLPGDEWYKGMLLMDNVGVRNAFNVSRRAFHAKTTAGDNSIMWISNCKFRNKIYLERIFDSHLWQIETPTIESLYSVTGSHFTDFYVGGGGDNNLVIAGNSHDLRFTGMRFDNALGNVTGGQNDSTIRIDKGDDIEFTGCEYTLTNNLRADNRYWIFEVGANANRIKISGGIMQGNREYWGAVQEYGLYGIKEIAGTTDNQYEGIKFRRIRNLSTADAGAEIWLDSGSESAVLACTRENGKWGRVIM